MKHMRKHGPDRKPGHKSGKPKLGGKFRPHTSGKSRPGGPRDLRASTRVDPSLRGELGAALGDPTGAASRAGWQDDDVVSAEGERGADDAAGAAHADAPALVRLNKYLADHGVGSRRRCDELISAGKVTVDGEPVHELGLKIDALRQRVEIDGYVLKPALARRRYYLLNKPAGVVCTNEERETRPRAVDLVTDREKGRIYTIGRLDEESKGLILLTNDGDFANRIMHPRFGIEKTYVVKVHGKIDDDALQKIRDGVHLSEGRTAGARILVLKRGRDSSVLSLTLHEGMNREIRRVFARVGFKVLDLRRTRIGTLNDRGLKIGRWRPLTRPEIEELRAGKNDAPDSVRSRGRGPRRPHAPKSRRPWTRSEPHARRRPFGKKPAFAKRSRPFEDGSSFIERDRPIDGERGFTKRQRPFKGQPAFVQRGRPFEEQPDVAKRSRPHGDKRGLTKRPRPFADKPIFAKRSRPFDDQPGFTKRHRPFAGKPAFAKRGERFNGTPGGIGDRRGATKRSRPSDHKPGFAKRKPAPRRSNR